MEVIITNSGEELSCIVADAICKALASRAEPALGLATGSSPLPAYRELIRRHKNEGLSFAHASAFLLDEYLGLPAGHDQLYRTFLEQNMTGQVDLDPARLMGPDSSTGDVTAECARYEKAIQDAGGLDLLLLGIGTDGHIAFNEPSSSLASRTRIKTLTRATREDNARFFGGDLGAVPQHVLTVGVGTILEARHLVLVANGPAKAHILARAIEGPITAMVPASALQMHPRVTVVSDAAAASGLQLADYYKETYAAKPR
ncbi:MAG: glucosamine-6-phosphate deaminase [Planctomycetota bacterium]|nr:glucosamine-6-phosphate deaminase [Planctomycetota bacterium]